MCATIERKTHNMTKHVNYAKYVAYRYILIIIPKGIYLASASSM